MEKYFSSKDDPKRKKMADNLIEDFNIDQRFEPVGFFTSFFQRYKNPERHKLLEKSQVKLEKELDLVKFIMRMRF